MEKNKTALEEIKKSYPEKFVSDDAIFKHVNRGDTIFIGTACGEPQHLVKALTDYASRNRQNENGQPTELACRCLSKHQTDAWR